MKDPQIVKNMAQSVVHHRHPAITRWNRLEGRPRTHDFDRALRAEARDAMWMLARQWQMGEFQGDDAGSPVLARACMDVSPLDRFQPGQGAVEALGANEPLEAKVECRPLPLRSGAHYLSLDLRLLVGRRWLKLLTRKSAGLSADYRDKYINAYTVPDPTPPEKEADAAVCAHPDAWQMASAASGRAMDGIALLEDLADHAYGKITASDADKHKLTTLATKLKEWFADLILQPPAAGKDAWLPERLEYQFGVSAPGPGQGPAGGREAVLRAEEYYHGHLDWYSLERRPEEECLEEPPEPVAVPESEEGTSGRRRVHTFLPAPIVFEGMPNTRWWAFEDRRTNFGEIRPDPTDLSKLLLIEFGLLYANDWFLLPCKLPLGQLTEVKGIAVSNVFGERFWIEPVREEPAAEGWEPCSLFTLGTSGSEAEPPPARLVLLPTALKVQESTPIEEIVLIRDEMANMVWAIEKRILLPSGTSRRGGEAAREFFEFLQRPLREKLEQMQARRAELEAIGERTRQESDELVQVIEDLKSILPPEPAAPIRYQVTSTVPEHWIPFLRVHVEGGVPETQLQRAALPRILEGGPRPPERVRPRTTLLRQNLPEAYFIHEEEVPRAGIVVHQSYQRTRWIGGKVVSWLGARKQTGRGEGWSGLRFDWLSLTQK